MSDSTKQLLWRGLILVLVGTAVWLSAKKAKAETTQEVAPYLVGTAGSTKVYKLVHQGCEIFVAENYQFQMNHGDAVAAGIATGRGCQ